MMRREPLHPVLANRPRRFLVGSAMVAAAFAAAGSGYYALVVGDGVAGATQAIAQTAKTGTRGDRLPAQDEVEASAWENAAQRATHNSVSKQAAEWGVRTCLGQIGQVSDFLTAGQSYSALSRKGPANAEESMFSATIAGSDKNGLASISSFVSGPVAGGKCNSAYQTVAAFPNSCEQVHKDRFESFGGKVEMGSTAESWTNGKGAYLHMLPLGDRGCVIVKTEMVF